MGTIGVHSLRLSSICLLKPFKYTWLNTPQKSEEESRIFFLLLKKVNENHNYLDNYNYIHPHQCMITAVGMYNKQSHVICLFKCLSSVKLWIPIGCLLLFVDFIPLCHYHYSCGVMFPIVIELEQLINLYSYCYSSDPSKILLLYSRISTGNISISFMF